MARVQKFIGPSVYCLGFVERTELKSAPGNNGQTLPLVRIQNCPPITGLRKGRGFLDIREETIITDTTSDEGYTRIDQSSSIHYLRIPKRKGYLDGGWNLTFKNKPDQTRQ